MEEGGHLVMTSSGIYSGSNLSVLPITPHISYIFFRSLVPLPARRMGGICLSSHSLGIPLVTLLGSSNYFGHRGTFYHGRLGHHLYNYWLWHTSAWRIFYNVKQGRKEFIRIHHKQHNVSEIMCLFPLQKKNNAHVQILPQALWIQKFIYLKQTTGFL